MTTNKGNSVVTRLPRFSKVYLPGESKEDLDIPVSFNSCLPNPMPNNVIVRSIYGNVWKLKLVKSCGDVERYEMVHGWKKIVKDEALKGGEFLTFEFDGSMRFNFCIYDNNTTCKRLGSSVEVNEMEDVVVVEDGESSDDMDDDDVDEDYVDENDQNDNVEAADEDVDVEADGEGDGDDGDDGDGDDDDDDGNDDDDDDEKEYFDDSENPSFSLILNPKKKSQLHIPAYLIKDYSLSFPESIDLVDPVAAKFGTLEREIKVQGNGSVFVKGFGSVVRRNAIKTTDKMIFELKMSEGNLVNTIRVHIVRG